MANKPKQKGIPLGSFYDAATTIGLITALKETSKVAEGIASLAVSTNTSELMRLGIDMQNYLEQSKAQSSQLKSDMQRFLKQFANPSETNLLAKAAKTLAIQHLKEDEFLSTQLSITQESIDNAIQKTDNGYSPETRELLAIIKDRTDEIALLRSEYISLRKEFEALKKDKEQEIWEIQTAKVSKKGPRKYSDEVKLKALQDWDRLDKAKFPINVEDWLLERFGDKGGIPNVAKSTFYGWKKSLKYKN